MEALIELKSIYEEKYPFWQQRDRIVILLAVLADFEVVPWGESDIGKQKSGKLGTKETLMARN